jgi:positive regulator of sigma E activity
VDIVLETGTVTALEQRDGKKVALVAMDMPDEGREKCATCRMCSAESDGCLLLAAELERETDVTEGARVEVEINRPSLYVPILATLVVPLVGMTIGGILGSALGAGSEWKDLLAVGLAFLFGAVLFAGGYMLFGKHAKGKVASAKIRKIL